MTRTISLKTAIIGAAILAVVVGFAAWAIGSDSKQQSTGTFSVDAESVAITVTPYNAATGSPDSASWPSCSASGMSIGETTHCLLRVDNNKESSPIRFSWQTINVLNADGKDLASSLETTLLEATDANSCNAGASDVITGPVALSSMPGFGDPTAGTQAGDREMGAGQSRWLCVRLTYNPSGSQPFNSSTAATFKIDAEDSGLE